MKKWSTSMDRQEKSPKEKRTTMVTTFDGFHHDTKAILLSLWPTTAEDKVFTNPPRLAFRTTKNLKNRLTTARLKDN